MGVDGDTAPDVHFELGRLPRGDRPIADFRSPLGRLTFALDPRGSRVWAEYSSGTIVRSADDVAALLLGRVLGGVLRRRSCISLHGCVIEIGSGAVALLGAVGAGKSTLAAAFANAGHAVLSDDIVAVARDGHAQPGYPRLRLAPPTVAALPAGAALAGPVATGLEKRYAKLRVGATAGAWRFQPRPLPLTAIYLLERDGGGAPRVDEISGAKRLAAVACHLREPYGPLPRDTRAAELRRLAEVARSVPVRRLTYQDGFANLDVARETLVADAA